MAVPSEARAVLSSRNFTNIRAINRDGLYVSTLTAKRELNPARIDGARFHKTSVPPRKKVGQSYHRRMMQRRCILRLLQVQTDQR